MAKKKAKKHKKFIKGAVIKLEIFGKDVVLDAKKNKSFMNALVKFVSKEILTRRDLQLMLQRDLKCSKEEMLLVDDILREAAGKKSSPRKKKESKKKTAKKKK
jgi:hypothetical protein